MTEEAEFVLGPPTARRSMTEEDWLAATGPWPIMDHLGGRAGGRKLRLLAVACCRRVEALLPDGLSRAALTTAERHADGSASSGDLASARQDASVEGGPEAEPEEEAPASVVCRWDAAKAVWHATGQPITTSSMGAARRAVTNAAWAAVERYAPEVAECSRAESATQAGLTRDIFGNPFRPVTLDAVWRTSTDVAMATQMYHSRDFSPMPILADALQDAGCENDDILNHCRGPSPHVRGCWVVDLVLGKE